MKRFHFVFTLAIVLSAAFSAPVFSGSPPARAFQRTDRSEVLAILIINANPHVKPYLPRDVSGKDEPDGNCNPDGTLNPRNHDGTCYTISSVDKRSFWLFRTTRGGAHGWMIEKVFKLHNGNIVPWVVFDLKNQNIVTYSSQEAQRFAGTRNDNDPNMAGTPPQNPEKNAAEVPMNAPHSPSPTPAGTNPVENILKNGVTDLLKGLGR